MKKNTWRFGVGVTVLCAAILFLVPLFITNIKTKLADDGAYLTIHSGFSSVQSLHFQSDKELIALGHPSNFKTRDPSRIGHWEIPTGKQLSLETATATANSKFNLLSVWHGSPPHKISDEIYHSKTLPVWPKTDSRKEFTWKIQYSPQSDMIASAVDIHENKANNRNVTHIQIQARDASTGKKIWFVDEGSNFEDHYFPLAFSTNGKWLAEGKGCIDLRSVLTGKIFRTLKSGTPGDFPWRVSWKCIAFSENDSLLAAAMNDGFFSGYANTGTIYVWDLKTGVLRWKNSQPNMQPQSITFSPDGLSIACACYEFNRQAANSTGGAITLWNARKGKLIKIFTRETTTDRIALSTEIRKHVLLRKPYTGRYVSDKSYPFTALSFSPNSKFLAAGCEQDGDIKIWMVQ